MLRTEHLEVESSLESFFADGLITEIVGLVRQGKEATVYCCRGSSWSGCEYLAAKVYRPIDQRAFRNDAVYQPGRDRPLAARDRRALARKSHQGRMVQFGVWVHSEFETLKLLYDAGANVPEPIAVGGSALLMEFIGDGIEPAPMLARVSMTPEQARSCLKVILDNVALWLRNDRVHGDLSAYNILYREEGIVVIDFPQASDARFNPNARTLLERDIENVCNHFRCSGFEPDPLRISAEMWRRYRLGEL